ncbi:DUF1254 domain-containing protein [Vibrio splendidus]|uniref:DUF1254 domain-containing protein n=1 Tax=Vibrio splendidus TaxID=29497 RepID=UPI00076AB763|nr:DUF1214 domain-containing protein [Vibrio splendidus]PHX05300.1 hypothetical protein VSPL_30830 [Vibrio splendidus]
MKKSIIALSIAALSFTALAADHHVSIPEIDSSNWAVNPVDHGMTAGEFITAEVSAFMNHFIKMNGINNFHHWPELTRADDHFVVSPNQDTVYSLVIVNTSQDFTLELPDTGDRFITTHVMDGNHSTPFYLYGGGTYEFKATDFETEFAMLGFRVGTDGSEEDAEYIRTHIQPKMAVHGTATNDVLPMPDLETLVKVRTALITEYDKLDSTSGVMTDSVAAQTDWEKFTYVSAGALVLSPDRTAMYHPYAFEGAVGGKCYEATYPAVPAEEFFSITVYGQDKYLMGNEDNVVSSQQDAIIKADGSFDVVYGDYSCKQEGKNFVYTPKDNWSFLMRAYRPNVDAFNAYVMPEIKRVK